ncbi:MAG: adenylate/guanylate cyclase domain-containing protein [Kiloniellales bacterium]|nr:adenylate/guanylate cyclase domain-containing protein [Kiloniellales bacterium]
MPEGPSSQVIDDEVADPVASPEAKNDRPAPRRRRRRLLRALGGFGLGRVLAFALLVVLLAARLWDPVPLEILRLKIFDLYQLAKPRDFTPQPVVIIDLDEPSLATVGQWPWPRTIVADLVREVFEAGAAALAFDVVFPEPDRSSAGSVAEALRGVDESLREELRALPSNDVWLARMLKQTRVVLGQSGYGGEVLDEERRLKYVSVATVGGDPRRFLTKFENAVQNIPVLENAASGIGMISVVPERDGIVRRVPAVLMVKDQIAPALSLELLRVATGQQTYAIKRQEGGIDGVVIANALIQTDKHGQIWVHYSGHRPERYVSAKDVLSGAVPKEKLAGKLVLFGTSAVGLLDIKSTPVDRAIPGVEVHAEILEGILSQSFLTRPHLAIAGELVVTAFVGLIIITLVPLLGALWTLILGGAVSASLAAGSWYLYVKEGLLVDVAFAMVAGLFLYALLVYENYLREERQRRQVRGAFSQYLSPALVEQLAENPDRLVLGGETREMTVLFCDVRGFTSISEQFKADPQGLTTLINRLLTPLTDAILETGGTIDKYMGDCIMAFWNAPLDDSDHASHACQAALVMLRRVEALNAEREAEAEAAGEDFIPLKVGIGINSGDCTVGNVGSEQRFDYSVLGDAVNLASRLEGQSKNYGVEIVLGSRTAAAVRDDLAVLELDLIAVKGKKEPERIFALLGDEAMAQDPAFTVFARKNGDLLHDYRNQEWPQARTVAADCRELDPTQRLGTLYELHESRIAQFQAEPPGPDWDGVFVATTK